MFVRTTSWLIGALLLVAVFPWQAHAESNADYTHTPTFMSNDVTPNVMILLDTSGSMNDMAYQNAYDPATTYYGYFTSAFTYSYASNKFSIDATGDWSGNFLNWATMRRIDVARKVLVGGLATSRTGGGNTTNIGDSGSGWFVYKWGSDSDAASLSPYVGAQYAYTLDGGYLKIWDGVAGDYVQDGGSDLAYTIKVNKDNVNEPDDFLNGDLAGLMQKVADKARWGIAFFNSTGQGSSEGGTGSARDGAYVSQPITGTGYGTNFLTDIENTTADSWTPLAESLYQVAGYFAQDSSMAYRSANYPTTPVGKDPYYFSDYSQYVTCPKSFVLIITDGMSTMDSNIPSTAPIGSGNLQDYDGDGEDYTPTSSDSYTSDYLDDVALWAHTQDLRSDLANDQTLTIYTVYAFGTDATAETLLKNTAKNGAFTDSNGSGTADVDSEWDTDGDGVPDTYYQASDGAMLETELMSAITDILKRATSGTALSVLATSATGAGHVYQAYFLPAETIIDSSGSRDIEWLGHLLSMNIDSYGHLRDKSNNCIAFTYDSAAAETRVQTLTESGGICTTSISSEIALTSWTGYNWNAGEVLAKTSFLDRNIYTFKDDGDGVPGLNEVVTLSSLSATPAYLGVSTTAEADDVITFVQGDAISGLRDRTNADGNEWKLGDIIHSTPTVVGTPMEAYGLLYQDSTYNTYYSTHKSRNTVIYVGANDGMLHAFKDTDGSENWGFVPYNLIPHLRWLKETTYSHVYYVDLKAKASDVQTFSCNASHTGRNTDSGLCWGSLMLAGMRMGGGQISDSGFDIDGNGDSPVSRQRKFTSSYTALDITDATATQPTVLWEFGHNLDTRFPTMITNRAELGFTLTYPSIVKVGTKWFAIFGSGSQAEYVPDYNGDSNQKAKVFVVDIATGDLKKVFTTKDNYSIFSDPVAVDLDFSKSNVPSDGTSVTYNTDAVYIGESYKSGSNYYGRIWRIAINNEVDPANWDMNLLFNTDSGEPIEAGAATASDDNSKVWVYFGTGRYFSDSDKTDTQQQKFFGIKEPCWDPSTGSWDATCISANSAITDSNYNSPAVANSTSVLMDVSSSVVTTSGTVSGVSGGVGSTPTTFNELVTVADNSSGWFRQFPDSGERSLNKPTIIGGLVLFTSFVPSSDLCGYGGSSFFYSLYYKTGTAYSSSTIGTSSSDSTKILARSETASTGMGSQVAVHSGQESCGKAYIQLSTGEAQALDFESAISFKSKIISWREI